MIFSFNTKSGKPLSFVVRDISPDDSCNELFALVAPDGQGEEKAFVKISFPDQLSQIKIEEIDNSLDVAEDELEEVLETLQEEIIHAIADGEDFADEPLSNLPSHEEKKKDKEPKPYDPELIRVDSQNLSLRYLMDMIEEGDLDLSPDFQRNFVWDLTRKSRLIESIMLRIPIPVFYFSQNKDGLMQVVDGLQRLTTIYQFIKGKFALQDLEYLKDLNGKRFPKNPKERLDLVNFIDAKYIRRINTTQLQVNVIDYSSPTVVKYDIFRRINTGGRPLNAQEMRNCLMSQDLRETLNKMVNLESFKNTTDRSIPTVRMQAQEMALRFIAFRELAEKTGDFSQYSGQMDDFLDEEAAKFSSYRPGNLTKYVELFDRAMKNAKWLFGRHAFRKVHGWTEDRSGRSIINKALFISWAVALSFIPDEDVKKDYGHHSMTKRLGQEIDFDTDFSWLLSTGTNGWKNLMVAYSKAQDLLDESV